MMGINNLEWVLAGLITMLLRDRAPSYHSLSLSHFNKWVCSHLRTLATEVLSAISARSDLSAMTGSRQRAALRITTTGDVHVKPSLSALPVSPPLPVS
jgi:hypothetical protein